MTTISSHIPIIWAYVVIDMLGTIIHEEAGYSEENAAEEFITSLLKWEWKLRKKMKQDVGKPRPTNAEIQAHKVCHHCEQPFTSEGMKKPVMDHCHYSGRFIGMAHK